MTTYITGAESLGTIVSNAVGRGNQVRRPDQVVTTVGGKGEGHAIRTDTGVTACGTIEADALHRLPTQSWEHLNPWLKCPRCIEVAG